MLILLCVVWLVIMIAMIGAWGITGLILSMIFPALLLIFFIRGLVRRRNGPEAPDDREDSSASWADDRRDAYGYTDDDYASMNLTHNDAFDSSHKS